MKKNYSKLKKTLFFTFVLTFTCFNVKGSDLLVKIDESPNPVLIIDGIENESSVDGLFKKNKYKKNKSPNYTKKRNKPSPISQYNLKNQSRSAVKSIKRNNKSHFSSKRRMTKHHRGFHIYHINRL